MSKNISCIVCGIERQKGRRYCRSCYLARVREQSRVRGRYTKLVACSLCNNTFKQWRPIQTMCANCYKASIKTGYTNNSYVFSKYVKGQSIHLHRRIAENVLGRKLHKDEVVHHIDENVTNNKLTNLMVLDRKTHSKLHSYLRKERVALEKSRDENWENCWNILRASITTAWLETTGAKVLKIWEIGQSAAEHRTDEGSETMYPTSKTRNSHDEDIVQTTKR